MKPISIYIVDDHRTMRTLFRAMLRGDDELVVVGDSGDAEQGIEQIKELNPDILLVDQNLTGSSGLDVIKLVRATRSKIKSILMSMGSLKLWEKECMQLSVPAMMSKSCSKNEIIRIIKSVAKGNTHYDV